MPSQHQIECVTDLLRSFHTDMQDPNNEGTPKRFIRYLMEFHKHFDPASLLGGGFPVEDGFHSMVVQSNIPFRGICAHHLLPMLGHASLGYIPQERIVGISKLTRLVDAVGTEKPGLQELFCDRVTDLLMEHLHPLGAICVIHSRHGCMGCRGVTQADVITSTSSVRGAFRDNPTARLEFYEIIKGAS